MTLLSVVVPVYGVEAFVGECLDSILSHTGYDIEVIAVDDASPDRCPRILDEYAARDPRVRVLHLPANVGLGQARNAGMEAARGEYIWFVDSDDWLPEGAMSAVVDRLRAIRAEVLVIDHAEVFGDGVQVAEPRVGDLVGVLPLPIHLSKRPELLRIAQSACTKIAKRRLYDRMGLRFAPGWYEDSYFSHAVLMAAESIDVLTQPMYSYRQRTPGSITNSQSERHFEVFAQYDRLFAMVDEAADAYEVFRPELFRLMINHLLVITGNRWRLPPSQRRRFFRRTAQVYRQRRPGSGYAVPFGVDRLKHWLVAHDFYAGYAMLRFVHLMLAPVTRLFDLRRRQRRHPEPGVADLGRRVALRQRRATGGDRERARSLRRVGSHRGERG